MTLLAKLRTALTPPVVSRAFRPRAQASWEAAGAKATTYEGEVLNRFRVERHRLRVPDGSLLRESVFNLALRAIDRANVSIVDFGGATGDLGLEIMTAHPGVKYTVVENPKLVEMMEGRSVVKFTTAIPDHCDIFFTSGTLQYVERPLDVLRRGLESARHLAILTRNSFARRSRIIVQKSHLFENGVGPIPAGFTNQIISYPHRSLVEGEIEAVAEEMGFQCIASLAEGSGALFGTYGRQLVFERVRGR